MKIITSNTLKNSYLSRMTSVTKLFGLPSRFYRFFIMDLTPFRSVLRTLYP